MVAHLHPTTGADVMGSERIDLGCGRVPEVSKKMASNKVIALVERDRKPCRQFRVFVFDFDFYEVTFD